MPRHPALPSSAGVATVVSGAWNARTRLHTAVAVKQARRRPRTGLANVRHADRIYVLHHGKLVEAGNHDELVAAVGRYAELFRLQSSGCLDGAPPTGSETDQHRAVDGGKPE
jgi:hypothetical protein